MFWVQKGVRGLEDYNVLLVGPPAVGPRLLMGNWIERPMVLVMKTRWC